MSPAWNESALRESSSVCSPNPQCVLPRSVGGNRGFSHLRGVQWRINLGILPSSSSSIDDIRRVTADSRRRYAGLRRRLLVDPHLPKDKSSSRNLVMDNPLSQNPDSMWGRFFRNAELEKMVDQDLSRLYPEHMSYFQTPGCQVMLRRILLLWCLKHPEYGYRQGMHELLAPLLYVVHVDVERLSEVRRLYEDHFADKFDGLSFHENNHIYDFELKKFPDPIEDEIVSHNNTGKVSSLDELDPEIQTIVLLSDAYGAEGELGVVLSEKFMEHDCFCMFDSLMSGADGVVAMAEFFSPSGSQAGLPPVIEASSALYHLLSFADSSLHSHLIELGVEPQYFSLRWLRVLFGREFSLDDLLVIWDEILASDNSKLNEGSKDDVGPVGILCSPRGAFIAAMAVSMLLHSRSSLLATENATSCLQRLLNFPKNINLTELIGKAKSLQALALDTNFSSPFPLTNGTPERSKSVVGRAHSLSSDATSPKTPLNLVRESYWEEKWRVLHKAEEQMQGSSERKKPGHKRGWSEKIRQSLSRTESAPSPASVDTGGKDPRSSVRRNLLKDLSQKLSAEEEGIEKLGDGELSGQKGLQFAEEEARAQESMENNLCCTTAERCLSGNTGSDENSSIFSPPTSPEGRGANGNDTGSSVASNLSIDETVYDPNGAEALQTAMDDSPLPVSDPLGDISPQSECKDDSTGKSSSGLKDRKVLSGKFLWFWKLGRNPAAEGTAAGTHEARRSTGGGSTGSSMFRGNSSASLSSKGDSADQGAMVTLRNLGQSMLENIQVIESAFQQDHVTAMAALKELRKISSILSEM